MSKQTKIVMGVVTGGIIIAAAIIIVALLTLPAPVKTVAPDAIAASASYGDGETITIYENEVTNRVQKNRYANGTESDDGWRQWLHDNAYSAASMREEVIREILSERVMELAAKDAGIVINDEEVEMQIAQTQAGLELDDAAFEEYLKTMGYADRDQYRKEIKASLVEERLRTAVPPTDDPWLSSEEGTLWFVNQIASDYTGLPALSCIVLDLNNTEVQQDAIAAAKEDFESAKDRYGNGNTDFDGIPGITAKDSDPVIMETTQNIKAGDITDVVFGENYAFIVRADSVYTPPAVYSSLDEVPSVFMEEFKKRMQDYARDQGFWQYKQQLVDDVECTINDMPAALPYDVAEKE